MEKNKKHELYDVIEKWTDFCIWYPRDFIEKVWGGTTLESHFKDRFEDYHNDMNRFFKSLDINNSNKLIEYVMNKD